MKQYLRNFQDKLFFFYSTQILVLKFDTKFWFKKHGKHQIFSRIFLAEDFEKQFFL